MDFLNTRVTPRVSVARTRMLAGFTLMLVLLAGGARAEQASLSLRADLVLAPVFLTNTTQLSITINNTGDVNLTNITLEDRFLERLFNLSGFSAVPQTNASGLVRIIGVEGVTPLAPNQTITVVLNFTPLANDSLANHTFNASAMGLFNATSNLTLLSTASPLTWVATPIAGDAFEPDNNATQAQGIALNGSPQIHTFGPSGDQDWIVFSARQGSTYDIAVSNITAVLNNSRSLTDSFLTLLNETLAVVQTHDDTLANISVNPHIVWTAPTTGKYFVRVTEASGSPAGPQGTYEIRVTEQGRLGPLSFAASASTVFPGAIFTVNASFRCSQGRCSDVALTLDPEPIPRSLHEKLRSDGQARVIIKTKQPAQGMHGEVSPRQQTASIQSSVISAMPQTGFALGKLLPAVSMITGTLTPEGLAMLEGNPDIEAVYLDYPVHASLNASRPRIRADQAANLTVKNQSITGAGIGVCVIDTGIAYTHADFGNCTLAQVQNGSCAAVQPGFDFVNNDSDPLDDHGHGSHVAGIIASRDPVFTGIAPGASIIPIKALDASGGGFSSDIIAGIDWCITNASRYNITAITMSLGDNTRSQAACDSANAFADPINQAVQAGILVSVASGNSGFGTSGDDGIASPACVSNATSVGATTTATDALASFTNRGANLKLLAPGQPIIATDFSSSTGHTSKQGTSMAAPHVSGAAALVAQFFKLAYNRTPAPADLQAILATNGVFILDNSSGLVLARIDALSAAHAKGVVPMIPGAKPFWTPSQNPVACGTLLENQTCNATWTVNASLAPGTYEFYAIASQQFDRNITGKTNVTILAANSLPVFTSAPPTTATLNTTYTYDAEAIDQDGDAIIFNLTAFPAGMTINSTTGLIVWLANATGNHTVTVTASDSHGASAVQNYTLEVLTVNRGPAITTVPILTATEDALYTYDVNATDLDDDPVTFTLITGPSGMAISSSTGVITFTPLNNQVGTAGVTVRATDPFGASGNQSYTLLILNNAPAITTTPRLTVDERANFTYDANSSDDGQGTITYTLDLSPAGMTVNASTGVVAWTPLTTQVGAANVSLRVGDGNGGSSVQNFTITVTDRTPPNVTLLSPANATVFNTTAIAVSFAASDNAGIASCTVRVNTSTATVFIGSGALNKSQAITAAVNLTQGHNSVNATCTDPSSLSNTSRTIIVFADSIAPLITIISPVNGQNVTGNVTVNYTVADATLDKVLIAFAGQTVFANASGIVVFNASEGLGQNLTITANDSVGLASNTTIRVNVDQTPPTAVLGVNASTTIFSARGSIVFATAINSSDNLGIASTAFDFDAADGVTSVDASSPNATTNYTSPGAFVVTLTVTDVAGAIARANATVTVARDSDGDGFPDEPASGFATDTCPLVFNASNNPEACANDSDGDGVLDALDFIFGNASHIVGNIPLPGLTVGSSANPATASGLQTITITSNGVLLITFDFNLSNMSRLVMPNITIIRDTASVLVSGLPSPINKTILLPKNVSSHNAVCVKDARAQSLAELTSNCTGAGEIQVNCTGASQGKTCIDTGSGLRVSNLAHTIIRSFALPGVTQPQQSGGINGTLVQNGSAVVTEQPSEGGNSFNVRGERETSRAVSSSFTPSTIGAVALPTTTAPSAKEQAPTASVIIKKPGQREEEAPAARTEEGYFVGPAPQAPLGWIILLIGLIAAALCLVLVLAVLWALRR